MSVLFDKKKSDNQGVSNQEKIKILYDKYEHQFEKLQQKMQNNHYKCKKITGIVVVSDDKEKQIKFPTANVCYDNLDIQSGFYQSSIEFNGKQYGGLTLIDSEQCLSKTYIFDFNQNLYGRKINIELTKIISYTQDIKQVSLAEQFQNNIESLKKTLFS